MKHTLILLIVGCLLALTVIGCGKKDDTYGQPIVKEQPTELKTILTQPTDYNGKTVTLQGKIVRQCPTGCWFDIQEGNATVHVDINPSGFAIPQNPGKTVLVEGTVQVEGDTVEVIGTGVKIQ